MVEISNCVNEHKLGNKVRLNAGDVVTVSAFYDADPTSTKYLPLPGGVVTGHLPQISSHGAGSHASITFDLPSGVLFSLMQASQSEHHFSSLPPGEHRS